jgi:peptidoglycan/LPS O-acetylase OafA/YrhL
MPGRAHERSLALDCVRGLAILLAMGWHLNGVSGILPLDLLLEPGRMVGWVGVDLFFVLSGFLVGGLILRELAETYSRYFHHYEAAPLMIVNTAHFNPGTHDADFATLVRQIAEMRGRRSFFNQAV